VTINLEQPTILTELRALLRYHALLGIDSYPKSTAIANFLHFAPPAGAQEVGASRVGSQVPTGKALADRVVAQGQQAEAPVKLTDIAGEVADCRACTLHRQRLYPVPGRGVKGVRLVIVGDWLTGDAGEKELPTGHLFGAEQDAMLARMLAAIKLAPTEVYITNAIKCAIPADCQPQAEHLGACLSFLRRELALLAPEIICTMGMVATRALLEQSAPLSSLRSRFHPLPGTGQPPSVVLATYHPTFLLQNPEMKRAAWADLQLLAKRLDQSA
jgi:DNA polymerase